MKVIIKTNTDIEQVFVYSDDKMLFSARKELAQVFDIQDAKKVIKRFKALGYRHKFGTESI